MFGGVDIFGSKKKEKVDQEPSQDLTGSTEAPPTQPKPAAKSGRTLSSGSGGLFGEGGEEKDDDDIFSFQTASRKHKCVELVILVF